MGIVSSSFTFVTVRVTGADASIVSILTVTPRSYGGPWADRVDARGWQKMRLDEVEGLARRLMDQHGLDGWELRFDGAKARAGICRFDRKVIGLSRHLMALFDRDEVTDTVLHEVAHALVGPRHGHDEVWKATARTIGASATRCVSEHAPAVHGAWTGTCPKGHHVMRHRRPLRVASCARCSPDFDLEALITWRRDGRLVPMSDRYEAELRALRRRHTAGGAELPLLGLLDGRWAQAG